MVQRAASTSARLAPRCSYGKTAYSAINEFIETQLRLWLSAEAELVTIVSLLRRNAVAVHLVRDATPEILSVAFLQLLTRHIVRRKARRVPMYVS